MSEIVCPSCQSRYEVPEGAIGSDGRKVKCASCAHIWLAVPEPSQALEEVAADSAVGGATPHPVSDDRAAGVEDAEPAPGESAMAGDESNPEEAKGSLLDEAMAALEARAPGDLLPSALRNAAGSGGAAEQAAEQDGQDGAVSAAAGADDDLDAERFLPAEPQAGRPDYMDDDKAYADPHEVAAPELEPYGDDEDLVVYDDDDPDAGDADEAVTPAAPAVAATQEDVDLSEEEAAEVAERALELAKSPVENMRQGQMAEIRQMLDELQSDSAAELPPLDDDAAPGAAEADQIPSRPYEDDEQRDPFKERLAAVSGGTIPGFKPIKKEKDYDRSKLMKKHQRRYRRRKIAESRSRPSAFTTGFMLIVMVAVLMAGVYLLHPQIIARLPETEPALLEYVQWIDGLRVVVGEKIEVLKSMIDDAIERAA